ncbi:MAG TPA: SDR family oxidoreductase [Eudoraea sp.]|nr:SDR family oxidoreductase [Eudoraea sp.]
MYSGIKGKVAIVTGAGTGIGYAIVALLLEAGAKVVMNDIDPDVAEKAASALDHSFPGACLAYPGDAGDIAVIDGLISFTLRNFERIDFVIPNAGITLFGDFFNFTPEDFRKVINLNLEGAFFLVQKATRIMKDQGDGGRVVLMSSITGIKSYPSLAAYSMTKAALRMLARSLVLVLGPHRITINAIAPGATLTERTAMEEPDYAGAWGKLLPTGNVGKPEDMAQTCLFLLSGEAAHINGQTLVVDGGWTVVGRYPGDLDQ